MLQNVPGEEDLTEGKNINNNNKNGVKPCLRRKSLWLEQTILDLRPTFFSSLQKESDKSITTTSVQCVQRTHLLISSGETKCDGAKYLDKMKFVEAFKHLFALPISTFFLF